MPGAFNMSRAVFTTDYLSKGNSSGLLIIHYDRLTPPQITSVAIQRNPDDHPRLITQTVRRRPALRSAIEKLISDEERYVENRMKEYAEDEHYY